MIRKPKEMSDEELKTQFTLMVFSAIVVLFGFIYSFINSKSFVTVFLILGIFVSIYFKVYVTEITKRRSQGNWSFK